MMGENYQNKLNHLLQNQHRNNAIVDDKLLEKNLLLLEKNIPGTKTSIENHQPTRFVIKKDDDENKNLWDKETNSFVYSKDPKIVAKEQCQDFLINSKPCQITPLKENKQWSIEPRFIDKIIDIYEEQGTNDNPLEFAGLLILSGIGLGYHIKALIEKLEINYLALVDINLDTLKASMQVIDWHPVFEYFNQPGKKLFFMIDENNDNHLETISQLVNEHGLFLGASTHIFCHLGGGVYQGFINTLVNKYIHIFNQQGFFEDEQVSVAHTYHNLKANDGILSKPNVTIELPPCLIVGNGPSLDENIDYIKKNQNKFIIFSAGSSLEPLLNNGIKADYHVMLERTIDTEVIAKRLCVSNKTKDLTALAMNTIPPETKKYFNEYFLGFKKNDAGTFLYQSLYPQNTTLKLSYCTPTASNAAISFALHMGFSKILLLGVDCGMKDSKKHHSKHSSYFKKDNFLGDFNNNEVYISCQGNFGSNIMTNPVMLTSLLNIGKLIKTFPNATVFNGSDGAFIHNTTPINKKEIETIHLKKIDKKSIKKLIKKNSFQKNQNIISKKKIADEVSALESYIQNIDLQISSLKKIDYFHKICTIHKNLKSIKSRSPLSEMLLKGSQSYFLLLSFLVIQNEKNPKNLPIHFKTCMDTYQQFLSFVKIVLNEHMTLNHQKSQPLFKQYLPKNKSIEEEND